MKTIEVKLYSFDELSEEAKEVALKKYTPTTDHIWSEAYDSVKKFNELFMLTEGHRSWLEYIDNYRESIRELKGLRLRKFILNNFGWALYRRRYRKSMPTHKIWTHKNTRQKSYGYAYYSSIFIDDTCCVLTGVCYDDNLLKPIYEFIEYKDSKNMQHTTLNDLFSDCFYSLKKAIEDEEQDLNSEESKSEYLQENGNVFLENGKEYLY